MEWITKFIHKQKHDTYNEALNSAIELIDNWTKENDLEYEIKHNEETGCNRVLFIYKKYPNGYTKHYIYPFIISGCYEPTGEYEEKEGFFGKYLDEKTVYKYHAHLDRC